MDILFLEKALTNSDWLGFKGNILSGIIGLIGAILGVLGTYWVMQKQLKAENEQYRRDRIDNTFFNLLGLFQNVQKELDKDDIIINLKKGIQDIRNGKHEEYMNNKFSKQKKQFIKDLEEYNDVTGGISEYDYNSLLKSIEDGDLDNLLFFSANMTTLHDPNRYNLYKKYMKGMEDFIKELEDEQLIYKYEIKESEIKGIIKKVFFGDEQYSGNYFRTLYRCLKYIMDSDLKMEDKKFYSGVLRGILSSDEMLVVFYNCMYFEKGEKFKELLEKEEDGKRIDFFGDKEDLKNLDKEYDLPFFSQEDLLFSETDMQKLEELIKGN